MNRLVKPMVTAAGILALSGVAIAQKGRRCKKLDGRHEP